jgi:class 3 adenylate cyclase
VESIVLVVVCVIALVVIGVLARALVLARRELRDLREASWRRPRTRFAGRAARAVLEATVRVRDTGVSGLLSSSLEDVQRWLSEDRDEVVQAMAPDGTVTVLFSDIANSTPLNERLGDDRWLTVLEAHNRIVRRQVRRRDGHVVKTQGDGFMVAFADPGDAARAGLGIQRAIGASRNRHLRREQVQVRIGMHVGVVVPRDGDYFGRNVAMSARVASAAEAGETLVSDELRTALADDPGFRFESRGNRELKGLTGTHHLWTVHPAA